MKTYKFQASYGDLKKDVEIEHVNLGPVGYHIYINRYYHGHFDQRNGEWMYLAPKPYFTTDDLQVLIEIIEREFKQDLPG